MEDRYLFTLHSTLFILVRGSGSSQNVKKCYSTFHSVYISTYIWKLEQDFKDSTFHSVYISTWSC